MSLRKVLAFLATDEGSSAIGILAGRFSARCLGVAAIINRKELHMLKSSLVRTGGFAMALALASVMVVGQEKGKASTKKEGASGRLPAHYSDVVTKEQRAKIYEVQAKYAPQIQKLKDQLAAAEMVQKEEIDAVLTKEQREQIAKLTAEAKNKKKGGKEKAAPSTK